MIASNTGYYPQTLILKVKTRRLTSIVPIPTVVVADTEESMLLLPTSSIAERRFPECLQGVDCELQPICRLTIPYRSK